MMAPAPRRSSVLAGARGGAVLYLALAAPAALVLAIAAIVRHDGTMLPAAAAILAGVAAAGALTGALVRWLRVESRAPWDGALVMALAIGIPALLAATLLVPHTLLLQISPPVGDAFAMLVRSPYVLVPAVGLVAVMLARPMPPGHTLFRLTDEARSARAEATFVAVLLVTYVLASLPLFRHRAMLSSSSIDDQSMMETVAREASRYPDDFETQYRYGNALALEEDCHRAVAPLRRAVQLRPHDADAANDYAFAVACAGDIAGMPTVHAFPRTRR